MKTKCIDIKDIFSLKKKNLNYLRHYQALSSPSDKYRHNLFHFMNKKDKEVIKFLNKHAKNKQQFSIWKGLINVWSIRTIDFILTNYKFLNSYLNKKKTYKIYNIKYESFSERGNDYLQDPESSYLWFISEFIKFKNFKFKTFRYKEKQIQRNFNKYVKDLFLRTNLKIRIYSTISLFFAKIFKPKYMIDDIGLSFKDLAKLNFSLKQLPYFWPNITYKNEAYNYNLRHKFLKSLKADNQFEIFYNRIIEKFLPKTFMENFDNIYETYKKKYPTNPKIYFTQNIHTPNNRKILVSLLKKNNAKILISQHGSLYGTSVYSVGENAERLVANKFITWGWKKTNKDIPFYSIKFSKFKKNNSNKEYGKDILFCTSLCCKYLNKPNVFPRQIIDSLETIQMINKISKCLRKFNNVKTVVRYLGKSQNSGFYIDKKLYSNLINFDNSEFKLSEELKKYKLVIHENFSSTSYLETISLDFPTIIFMKKDNQKYLDKSFHIYLKIFIKSKIVHTSTKSLQNFLKQNLNSIDAWWYSEEVRKTLKNFKKKYIDTTGEINYKINKLLKKS